jgi:beta-carotene hydroxylase
MSDSSLRAALVVPKVAWPTLALAGVALSLWFGGWALAVFGYWWAALAMLTVSAYLAFTPMHDASHRGLSQLPFLNEVIGRVCSLTLFGPFAAFRYVHLEHHKHTNDEGKDPDAWSGRRPAWLLPLRWITQDAHYYFVYLKAGRNRAEMAEVVGVLAAQLVAVVALCVSGRADLALVWFLSSRLALGFLAYSFDYLPHRPHTVRGKDNRYLATSVHPSFVLQVVLLNQNLHLIHHLHPAVPFYRYGKLWRQQEASLRAQGVRVLPLKHFEVSTAGST